MARLAAGLTGLTVGIGLLAVSLTAAAAVRGGPGTPGGSAVSLAAAAVAPTTITSHYSCDLSGYGSGLTPVTLSGTLTIPGTVVATEPLDISLATTASTALPASVVTALNGITEFAYAGSVTQKPAAPATSTATPPTPTASTTATATPTATPTPTTTATATPTASATPTTTASSSAVPLDGTAAAPATLSTIPTSTLSGAALFGLTGTAIIVTPAAKLTITPVTTTGALAAITCTTTDTARNVTVNVTPQTFGSTGPIYTCKESIAGVTDTIFLHVASGITDSGTRAVGKTETVTYTTPTFGAASWPDGTTRVDYTGSLPVTGAQPGKISLNQQIDLSAGELRLPGKLELTKAGTDQVAVPAKFTLAIDIADVTVPLTIGCTVNATPPPVQLSIAVSGAGGPGPTPSHTATSSPSATSTGTPGGQPQGSAAPSGAPDTGGGLGAASTVPMAVAGSAMAMGGAGLVLTAARRRRGRRA
jgi:hypothetical protein